MENVTGIFLTFVTATLPLALLVERGVTGLRLALGDRATKLGSPVWIALPIVAGIALCLGWQYNFVGPLARSVPALANTSRFDGIAGQLLTGLFVGALAGPLHEKIDEWNSRKKANNAVAASEPGQVIDVEPVV